MTARDVHNVPGALATSRGSARFFDVYDSKKCGLPLSGNQLLHGREPIVIVARVNFDTKNYVDSVIYVVSPTRAGWMWRPMVTIEMMT